MGDNVEAVQSDIKCTFQKEQKHQIDVLRYESSNYILVFTDTDLASGLNLALSL